VSAGCTVPAGARPKATNRDIYLYAYPARGDIAEGDFTDKLFDPDTASYIRYTYVWANITSLTVSSGVPEPSTWAMLLLGFAGLGFAGYRRTKNAGARFLAA
jgi:hypothetical protein